MKTIRKNTLLHFASLILFSFILTISCAKDEDEEPQKNYTCTTCNRTPQGLPENDNLAKGIYKGIIVGSTGTISFNIMNGTNTIIATMKLDGETANLTSTVNVSNGQPYLAPFKGMYQGNEITVTFEVGASGSTPTVVSSNIPGHPNAVFEIYKETSTSLIEAFEGNYTEGNTPGTFNVILSTATGMWRAVAKETPTGQLNYPAGTINSNNELIDSGGTKIGNKNGDVVNGTFTNSSGLQVIFSGDRTL